MTQVFQLVFLVAAGLALLTLYKEHSTGKADNVYSLLCMTTYANNPIVLFLL
jgi:hypothetical protein